MIQQLSLEKQSLDLLDVLQSEVPGPRYSDVTAAVISRLVVPAVAHTTQGPEEVVHLKEPSDWKKTSIGFAVSKHPLRHVLSPGLITQMPEQAKTTRSVLGTFSHDHLTEQISNYSIYSTPASGFSPPLEIVIFMELSETRSPNQTACVYTRPLVLVDEASLANRLLSHEYIEGMGHAVANFILNPAQLIAPKA